MFSTCTSASFAIVGLIGLTITTYRKYPLAASMPVDCSFRGTTPIFCQLMHSDLLSTYTLPTQVLLYPSEPQIHLPGCQTVINLRYTDASSHWAWVLPTLPTCILKVQDALRHSVLTYLGGASNILYFKTASYPPIRSLALKIFRDTYLKV